MKLVLMLLMALFTTLASAQPGPPRPDQGPPDRDWRDRDGFRPLSCEEWRRDARRHPCVRIPRRCWRG